MCGAVAHVKVGAVTGLKARLGLQKGREEVQRLSKLLQQSLQQQQQQQQQPPLGTPSFPPRGGPGPIGPIGPSAKLAQVSCLCHFCIYGHNPALVHEQYMSRNAVLTGCKILEMTQICRADIALAFGCCNAQVV